MAGTTLPTSLLASCHGLFSSLNLLPGPSLLLVCTFVAGLGGSFSPSWTSKLPELSSPSSTRRSHEDVLSRRSQSTSPGIHSTLCRRYRLARPLLSPRMAMLPFRAFFAPTQQVLNQCFLNFAMPSGPQTGVFRSITNSLISSARNLPPVRAEALLPLVGVPARPIGAVPPSRVRPRLWTTTAVSLPHRPTAFSWLTR